MLNAQNKQETLTNFKTLRNMVLRMFALHIKVNRNKQDNTYKNSRYQKNVISSLARKLTSTKPKVIFMFFFWPL